MASRGDRLVPGRAAEGTSYVRGPVDFFGELSDIKHSVALPTKARWDTATLIVQRGPRRKHRC
jgi:hypothetical protein